MNLNGMRVEEEDSSSKTWAAMIRSSLENCGLEGTFKRREGYDGGQGYMYWVLPAGYNL